MSRSVGRPPGLETPGNFALVSGAGLATVCPVADGEPSGSTGAASASRARGWLPSAGGDGTLGAGAGTAALKAAGGGGG